MAHDPHSSDILVIGSGAAGLTAALNLAQRFKVTVLAKGGFAEGSTAWAQGSIAAVLEPGDTFESHIEDTMIAGAGLNDRATVERVVENAPAAIAAGFCSTNTQRAGSRPWRRATARLACSCWRAGKRPPGRP